MGIWNNSRTSSTKLVWLILPFMVVAVFLGVKRSNWVDVSKVKASMITSYSSSLIKDDVAVVAEGPTVVEGGGVVAEGPSENYSVNSSYPPLAIEDEMDVELPVSFFVFTFYN